MRVGEYTQRVGAATPSKAKETPVALLTQVERSETSQSVKLRNEFKLLLSLTSEHAASKLAANGTDTANSHGTSMVSDTQSVHTSRMRPS